MIEQMNMFDMQKECKPCWRWYKDSMCWNCPDFVLPKQEQKRCPCGTCEECETPKSSWTAGCEYDHRKGKYYYGMNGELK